MVITKRSDSAEHSRSTPFLQSVLAAEFETQPITPYLTPIRPTGSKDRLTAIAGRRKFEVMERYTDVAAYLAI